MPLGGVSTGRPAHVLRSARPAPPAHAIDRQGLSAQLDEFVGAHRVVVLAAPAGFGKTSALSAWAEGCSYRLSWLTLTRNDRHAAQLTHRLIEALDELALARAGGEVSIAELLDPQRGRTEETKVLVIDDVHQAADPGPRAVLSELLEHAPAWLHIVMAGRHEPPLGLTRLMARGELRVLRHTDLAFSPAEVQLAADALSVPIRPERVQDLQRLTKGWPVAVRLALMTWPNFEPHLASALRIAADADIPQLADYLVENVISELPASLRLFVPRACTCDWLTGRLASELAGDSTAPELLEQALEVGLPIERQGMWRGEPVYRWHPVMAQAGRAILLRRDPGLASQLNRVAARFLAEVEPYEAASHALRGHDPELAAMLIRSNWLSAFMRGDSDLVEGLCNQLPAVWADEPGILAIRAACLRLRGDSVGAADLADRALLAAHDLRGEERRTYDLTRLLTSLFLEDVEDRLAEASARARRALAEDTSLAGGLRACGTLLLGWVELRLRHAQMAEHLLQEATRLCEVEGLESLAHRAWAYHTYSLAFMGDFSGAREGLAEADSLEHEARWRLADGDVEAFTRAFIDFWSGDHDAAFDAFQRAVSPMGTSTSFSHLARIGLVHAALARGEPHEICQAETLLDDLPVATVQGLPWGLWVGVARAGVLLSRSDSEAAAALLDHLFVDAPFAPAMIPLAAEFYWRCGRPVDARALALTLPRQAPGYLRVGTLVITALCERASGSVREAHELLAEALDLGAGLGLARPFRRPDPALADLLVEHVPRGTRQEAFLAAQIAYQRNAVRHQQVTALSEREQEVLSHLATTLTAAEISEALFISSNTLKTHLRSIYRKLGVESRREAVRLTYGPATQALPR